MKNLPNILTLVRIACAGVFAYFFVCHQYNACVITFIISMVSDVLDGAIARKYGCVSDLGKVLDPLADKITLLVVSVCFYTGLDNLAHACRRDNKRKPYDNRRADNAPLQCGGLFRPLRQGLHRAVLRQHNHGASRKNPASLLLRRARDLSTALFCMSIVCSFIALGHYARTQFMRRKAESLLAAVKAPAAS